MQMKLGACVAVLLGGACASAPSLAPVNDDAAVYAAALDSLAAPGKPLVVLDSTVTIRPDAPLLNDAQGMGADSAMRAGLRARSRASEAVPRLRIGRRVYYVHGGDLPRDPSGRAAFFARHGTGGYYRVSGVGYSSDRRRAILYVVHWCGLRCGESWLVMVVADPEGWRVQAVRLLTVI